MSKKSSQVTPAEPIGDLYDAMASAIADVLEHPDCAIAVVEGINEFYANLSNEYGSLARSVRTTLGSIAHRATCADRKQKAEVQTTSR